MRIESLPLGRTKYTFRQSGLNQFMLCPERARVEWFEDVRDDEPSDAAATGTALHEAIEADLLDADFVTSGELQAYAQYKFAQLDEEGVRYVQSDIQHANIFLSNMTHEWWHSPLRRELIADRAALKLEWPFDVLLDTNAAGDEIWVNGTIDCVRCTDYSVGAFTIYDWKTAASEYKGWEKQRWAKQPSVYTYAVNELLKPHVPPTFEYVVFSKKVNSCAIQRLVVDRTEAHWAWLKEQCWAITLLDPAQKWPLVDEHALCSAKWCPNWSRCKGALL